MTGTPTDAQSCKNLERLVKKIIRRDDGTRDLRNLW